MKQCKAIHGVWWWKRERVTDKNKLGSALGVQTGLFPHAGVLHVTAVEWWMAHCFSSLSCILPLIMPDFLYSSLCSTEALLRGSSAFLTYVGSKGRFLIKTELQATSSRPPPCLSFSPAQLRNNMFFFLVPSFYLLLFSCFPVIFSSLSSMPRLWCCMLMSACSI